MIIDTHAHLNHPVFDKDRENVIKRCLTNDVWVINVGTNIKTSEEVVILAEENRNIFAVIGLHPINLETGVLREKYKELNEEKTESIFNYEGYKKIAGSEKVVAIGEIGLDYYWKPKTIKRKQVFKEKQKELLLQQLKLAKELELPVVFHCRMASHDLIELLKNNSSLRPKNAVMHSFVGNLEELKQYLDFGFHIGFNGIIFKSLEGINFNEIIKNIPLDKILLETDCPYLSPPESGMKRNEPIFVKHTLKKIAKVKKIDVHKLSKIIVENTKKLFKI